MSLPIPAIAFDGLPKIGKSTAGRRLSKILPHLVYVSSSGLLSSFAQNHPDDLRSERIQQMFQTSAYLDDDTLVGVIRDSVGEMVAENVLHRDNTYALLDGVIRTCAQAQQFFDLFDVQEVWHFDPKNVDENELVRRMRVSGRNIENTDEKARGRLREYALHSPCLLSQYRMQGIPIFSFDAQPHQEEQRSIDMVYRTLERRACSLFPPPWVARKFNLYRERPNR